MYPCRPARRGSTRGNASLFNKKTAAAGGAEAASLFHLATRDRAPATPSVSPATIDFSRATAVFEGATRAEGRKQRGATGQPVGPISFFLLSPSYLVEVQVP